MEMQRGRVLYGKKGKGWTAMVDGNKKVILPTDGGRIFDGTKLRVPGPAEARPRLVADDTVLLHGVELDGDVFIAREWAVSSRNASI